MCLKLITDDLYDVASRLKSVKDSYVVYYNVEKGRFEVHDSVKNCLEFVVPFDELDARTVEYARYSKVERAKDILAEVEAHNRRLERQQAKSAIERAATSIEERRFNEG